MSGLGEVMDISEGLSARYRIFQPLRVRPPGTTLPSQLPERALLGAVIENAVHALLMSRGQDQPTRAWFASDELGCLGCFTFCYCCEQLDLDPAVVRVGVAAYLSARRRRRRVVTGRRHPPRTALAVQSMAVVDSG